MIWTLIVIGIACVILGPMLLDKLYEQMKNWER